MSYDGEVDEKDWCQDHACYIWQCSHPHPGSFEERHDAIDHVQNMMTLQPVSSEKNLCGWCHQPIKIQIFMGSGYCCEDHRKLLAGETGVANPNPRKVNDARRSQ